MGQAPAWVEWRTLQRMWEGWRMPGPGRASPRDASWSDTSATDPGAVCEMSCVFAWQRALRLHAAAESLAEAFNDVPGSTRRAGLRGLGRAAWRWVGGPKLPTVRWDVGSRDACVREGRSVDDSRLELYPDRIIIRPDAETAGQACTPKAADHKGYQRIIRSSRAVLAGLKILVSAVQSRPSPPLFSRPPART
jgi:hypothetical protein